MPRLLCAPLLLFLLALGGCEGEAVTKGGVLNSKPVRSIVSLSPSTSEIAGTIAGPRVRGRTAADDYPVSIQNAEVVASVKPDYEKITGLQPDLVVYDADLFNGQDVEKIKGLGLDTYVFQAKNLDDFIREIYLFGAKVGAETSASEYAEKIRAARDAAIADAPATKPRVAIVMPSSGSEHLVAGTASFFADLIRASGGEPVGPKSDKFAPLSPEAFLQNDPQIIIVPFPRDARDRAKSEAAALQAANTLLSDARLRPVAAIRNRQIAPMDEDIATRRGYRADQFIEQFRKRVQGFGGQG